ncbi:sulfotransferase 1C1-like [Pelobates fuscus]|uniref:sulfotransferase 1C1-like n=1 Tax=Pelobates fuscus TaxID=191477 RepID=UPI002FE4E518
MDPSVLDDIAKSLEGIDLSIGSIDGIQLPQITCDAWDIIQNFQAREDDILVATYPKAGTTWAHEIVDLILLEGNTEKAQRAPCFIKVPFIDLVLPKPAKSAVEVANEMESPRLLKTHLPIQLVPPSFWEKNAKVVYVARNAKDCMVSYYYFQKMNKGLPDPGTWDNYFSSFLSGEVPWGSWFDHVIGWWKARDKYQILYIFYEDMIEDPMREIRKITRFIGKNLSEEVLEKIKEHTSFKAMKENPMANYSAFPSSLMDQSISPFMRKGTVGDWKNHFLMSQNIVFEEEYKQKMDGAGLIFRDLLP